MLGACFRTLPLDRRLNVRGFESKARTSDFRELFAFVKIKYYLLNGVTEPASLSIHHNVLIYCGDDVMVYGQTTLIHSAVENEKRLMMMPMT